MSEHKYTIPEEFRGQLVYFEPEDKRSNDEILSSLKAFQPVTSELNIWAYWHSGISGMPEWTLNNVCDWVRINPGWTVRILDSVPRSPNEATRYLSPDMLASALVEGKMDGPYSGQHSADLLRGACLYSHGGVFQDVGVLECRDLNRICWNQLMDPNSPFRVCVPQMYGTTIANHWVAARKGDPFIKRWHDLFSHLWRNRTNHEGLIEDPLVSFGASISFEQAKENNFSWDFSVPAPVVMQYITQVLAWQRLCVLDDAGDGFSCADYWGKHVLIYDVLSENWGGEMTIGFKQSGQRMFDLFSLPVDGDQESEEWKEAYKLTWRLLTSSSMQKITHGKGITIDVQLGSLWDKYSGKDCAPGTFADLLRYGTVHFKQTRDSIKYADAPAVPKEKRLKKGITEP